MFLSENFEFSRKTETMDNDSQYIPSSSDCESDTSVGSSISSAAPVKKTTLKTPKSKPALKPRKRAAESSKKLLDVLDGVAKKRPVKRNHDEDGTDDADGKQGKSSKKRKDTVAKVRVDFSEKTPQNIEIPEYEAFLGQR